MSPAEFPLEGGVKLVPYVILFTLEPETPFVYPVITVPPRATAVPFILIELFSITVDFH